MNYTSGTGLPLDWFDSDQQRHITAHCMDNIPTMTVLAHPSSHRNTLLGTTCLLSRAQPKTAPHLWACSAQSHEWGPARGVARSKGGDTGSLGTPPTVGAGCNGAVGGGLAHPLHAVSPHAILWAPHAGDKVHTQRHRGVHPSLVRPRQGASHAAEGPLGPKQHDGVGRCCRSRAGTNRRKEREYSRNFWDESNRLGGDIQVSPTPLLPP